MIEKIFVTKPGLPDFEEYIEEIKSIWDNHILTNFGPKYQMLEEKLKERFHYEHLLLQCNGHMTLQNILSLLDPGEIITTPFTFVSTSLAIKNAGHKPVFCDIEPEYYNIDVAKIENKITEKTRAIVPVHVFGSPCEIEKLEALSEKYGLKLIFDAAHAFGCKYKGREIGLFGDASMFSFHATKVYHTVEGGMAVFKSAEMLEAVKRFSNFGIGQDGLMDGTGVNSKLNEFQAAMGIVNLNHFSDWVECRRKCVEHYDEHLGQLKELKLLKRQSENEYNYAYYPVVLQDDANISTEGLMELLTDGGIYARRYFYPAINQIKGFQGGDSTPVAAKIAEKIICLPLYGELKEQDVNRVISIIKKGLKYE